MNLKAIILSSVLFAAPVFAASLPYPFNTGGTINSVALAGGNIDIHYFSADNSPIYVLGTPSATWVKPDTNAAWVGPDTTTGNGVYTENYEATIDLEGVNPSTFSLTGLVAVDDNLNNIYVNGVANGVTIANGWTSLHSFTLNQGFKIGLNTIDFNLTNTGGPGGILVEFESASLAPEPGSYGLAGLGLVGCGLLRKKFRK